MWFVLCEMKRHAEACAVSGTSWEWVYVCVCVSGMCAHSFTMRTACKQASLVFVCLIILVSAFVSESEI